jgi:Flp pilus assembly protein TadG
MGTFLHSRRGSILLEAAFVMPILVLILFSMAEFGQAFMIKRRNAQVASTAADLVAQLSCVTTADLQDISNIGSTILQPYSATPLTLRISSVIQNANNATVQWSYGSGPLSVGSTFSLPAGLISQSQTIIVAQTSYAFTPSVGTFLTGGVTFSASAYNYPRVVSAIPLSASC